MNINLKKRFDKLKTNDIRIIQKNLEVLEVAVNILEILSKTTDDWGKKAEYTPYTIFEVKRKAKDLEKRIKLVENGSLDLIGFNIIFLMSLISTNKRD